MPPTERALEHQCLPAFLLQFLACLPACLHSLPALGPAIPSVAPFLPTRLVPPLITPDQVQMDLQELQLVAAEVATIDAALGDVRHSVSEAEAERQRLAAEGPAVHRRKDLLDKARPGRCAALRCAVLLRWLLGRKRLSSFLVVADQPV